MSVEEVTGLEAEAVSRRVSVCMNAHARAQESSIKPAVIVGEVKSIELSTTPNTSI